jgi:hypothetical protein
MDAVRDQGQGAAARCQDSDDPALLDRRRRTRRRRCCTRRARLCRQVLRYSSSAIRTSSPISSICKKRHPKTHLRSPMAMWDFWSLSPESLHQVTILMSDRGLPTSVRHVNGYGSHTYSLIRYLAIGGCRKPRRRARNGAQSRACCAACSISAATSLGCDS